MTLARDDNKIPGIELLRFASALAVLVFHYGQFAYQGAVLPTGFDPTAQPFYSVLQILYNYGLWGVEVFWCISGFIFFWKYGNRITRRLTPGYQFFVLRLSRLYPLHFATLLFVAGVQALYWSRTGSYFVYQNDDARHFVLQLFMASNWSAYAGDSFNGPIWSISLEVLVYAFFFLSLRYVSGSALLIALVALASYMIQRSIYPYRIFSCLTFFYLGCLTAVVYAHQKRGQWSGRVATAVAALALLSAVVLRVLGAVNQKNFLLISAASLIFLCAKHIRGTRISRWLVAAGNMTYSSYLLHFPIQLTVICFCVYAGRRVPVYSPVLFLSFMAATLWLSYWCYRLFEMPARAAIRRRLLGRPALR